LSLKDRIKKKKSELAQLRNIETSADSISYSDRYEELKSDLAEYINESADYNLFTEKYSEPERKNLLQSYLENRLDTKYQNLFISNVEKQKLILDVLNENNSFGLISQLFDDNSVDVIYINGVNEVLVEKDSKVFRTSLSFRDAKHLEKTINRMFMINKNDHKDNNAVLSKKMKNGTLITAVLPPIAQNGGYVVIKKFNKKFCNFDELIKRNFLTEGMANFLKYSYAKGLNIVITGAKNSGKTTLLGAMVKSEQTDDRTVFIKQSSEIENIPSNYLVLDNVNNNDENIFEKAILLNPAKIVYPDVDKEDLFNIFTRTEAGVVCCSTAKSAEYLLFSLVRDLSESNSFCSKKYIQDVLSNTIDLIVTTGRNKDGTARILSISQVASGSTEQMIQPLIEFKEIQSSDGSTKFSYQSRGFYPIFASNEELECFDIDFNFFEPDYIHEYEYQPKPAETTDTEMTEELEQNEVTLKHSKSNSIRSRFEL